MTVLALWLAVAPSYPTIVRKKFSLRETRRTFFSYHKKFSHSEKGEKFSCISEKERNTEKIRRSREST